jgi:hypothetical protein
MDVLPLGLSLVLLTPALALTLALSAPLQWLADRLRPPPDDVDPALGLVIAAALPAVGFAAACGGLLLVLAHSPPSILMTDTLAAMLFSAMAVIGVPGNAALSLYRVRQWSRSRRAHRLGFPHSPQEEP